MSITATTRHLLTAERAKVREQHEALQQYAASLRAQLDTVLADLVKSSTRLADLELDLISDDEGVDPWTA